MQVNPPGLVNLAVPAAAAPPRPVQPSTAAETARPVTPADEDTRAGESDAGVEKDGRRSRPGRLLDIRV